MNKKLFLLQSLATTLGGLEHLAPFMRSSIPSWKEQQSEDSKKEALAKAEEKRLRKLQKKSNFLDK